MPLTPPPADPSGHAGAGVSQWKRADCLGCDRQIVRARDAWVEIGGTRSGFYLVTWGAEPLLAHATDPDRLPDEPIYLLGIAHRGCLGTVRARAEDGSLGQQAADLPLLKIEQGPGLPELEYALHLPAEPDSCPFCGRTSGLTGEHVWPEWFSRELRTRGASLAGDHVRRGRIDLTVPVCGACNNTWMSVLENDVAPVLRWMMGAGAQSEAASRIEPDERARIAAWAVLKAYLLDAMAQPSVPRGFLHEFALRREPNESTTIWVAGYTPDVAARSEKRALNFPGRGGRTSNSPSGFVVTFTIFNVLFQVVGHFNGGSAVVLDRRWQYEYALFPIWPAPTTDILWPPTVGFSRASWDALIASVSDGTGA